MILREYKRYGFSVRRGGPEAFNKRVEVTADLKIVDVLDKNLGPSRLKYRKCSTAVSHRCVPNRVSYAASEAVEIKTHQP